MTLEDFFSITELKDGLTAPVRVNDLLTVMQNQKDDVIKNVTEATQHWSAVATTIAATENKDCLDLFVQLDGLSFIHKWLNDAQKFENDTGNKYLEEELIVKLLGAIEKLQIDNDKSVSSGIAKTVQNLVANGSSVVSDKARALCDMWTLISPCGNDKEEKVENVEKNGDKEETAPTKETVTDPVDSSIINISVKNETENSKLEGSMCEEISDVSELDKCVEDAKEKQETDKSSGSEEKDASSSADVENILESAMNGDTSDSSAENPKMKSNTESDEGDEDGKKEDSGNGSGFSELPKARDGDLMSNRPSDMEMDYGIVDPLEVARQVAMEVEQEVDDSREEEERSCSTSHNEKPKSPDSTNKKEPLNAEKGFSGFDLNQEVSSEEIDGPDDPISTPISVVSASRAAAAEGLPAAPLQFEGALGWKGSAATSAFRPIPEVPSKQRLDRLDFDLNVAEDSDDKTDKTEKTEKTETSIQRLQLDLNSLGDDDADVIRSSSSSSSIQPYFRNIDLNNTFLGNAYKQDESVISIFGTQVQIKQQPNGTIFDPPTDFSLGRAGPLTHYAHLPAYSHNGFAFSPPGAPVPYMGSRAPFMFNMDATGSNGAGPSRHGFDLNLDNNNNNINTNNNNNGGLRQFLNIGGKRQEPDSGWEAYPINYKHQQPPWQ